MGDRVATFTVEETLKATKGTLFKGSSRGTVRGVSTDSRTLKAGNLFVPIKGPRFDGHTYIPSALKKGASALLISETLSKEVIAEIDSDLERKAVLIQVDDTLQAYHGLARHHKERIGPVTVGVTGSNGKSTTKELTASVLSQRLKTWKNEANLNNEIGLPRTLLQLEEGDEAVVLEMGMRGLGEIDELCRIARPTIGILTNIGSAHMERLGSLEAIQKAKGELVEALGEEGTAILNADDDRVIALKEKHLGKTITYGIEKEAQVRAQSIEPEGNGVSFILEMAGVRRTVDLKLPGYFNVSNALAAAACGQALEIDCDSIVKGLEAFEGLPMRMEHSKVANLEIFNDSYNANPGSMVVGVRTLAQYPCRGPRVLVMGDMLELGESAEKAHREIGRMVVKEGIDYLVTCGDMSGFAVEEAILCGMKRNRAYRCQSWNDAVQILHEELEESSCLLVKGSRGSRMEKVIEGLTKMRKGN